MQPLRKVPSVEKQPRSAATPGKLNLGTGMAEPVFTLAGRQRTPRFVLFYPQQIKKRVLISHSSHLHTSGIAPELRCPKSEQCQGLGFRTDKKRSTQ